MPRPSKKEVIPSHEDQIVHLKRIEGQIRGAIEMIQERRYCLEIVSLCKGVRAGVSSVEENILMKYIDTCFSDTLYSGDKEERTEKLNELRLLFKKCR